MATAGHKRALNPTLKVFNVSDPSLSNIRSEVAKLLPETGNLAAVSSAEARKALLEAVAALPDEELRNFRGGQILIVA